MKTRLPLLLALSLILPATVLVQRANAARAAAAGAPGAAGARAPGAAARGPQSGPASGSDSNSPFSSDPSSSASPDNSNSQSNDSQDNSNMSTAERILNSDNLSVDSENGVFAWKNNKFDIGDNLVVRTRFERYLSLPGYADTNQEYQAILAQIQDLLSVDDSSPTKADKVYQAWQLLFKAAKFEQDGGASETLADQVFNAWRVRSELDDNRRQYAGLEDQRKVQQTDVGADTSNAEEAALETIKDNGQKAASAAGVVGSSAGNAAGNAAGRASGGQSSSGSASSSSSSFGGGSVTGNGVTLGGISTGGTGGGGATPTNAINPSTAGIVGSNQGTFDAMDLARTYAKEGILDAQATSTGLQAELQYQTQLLTFIMQRRFQHSLLAGMFYVHIFKGSEQKMTVGKDELSKVIDINSVVPTVNNFDFISHEAISEVDNTMKAVDTAYDAGERWTALQQLQQAFLLGEMLPSVQGFDPAKRHVLLNVYRETNDLKHMMDLHDFASAEDTITKIQADAPDFDAPPIISAIKEGKEVSNLALLAAQQAATTGDNDRMQAELAKAIQLWPLNPEIDDFSKQFRNASNMMATAGPKFDDLLAHGDDRQIFEQRDELGMALYNDPDRAAKLKEIVDRVGQVEMLIGLSDAAMKQNNGYAAWEALASAAKLEPDDPVLALAQRNVSARVANFVEALDSADRADQAGDYAASLNYYLQAQDIYPASQLSHDGIDEVGKKLMAAINPTGQTAKELAVPATPDNSSSSPGASGGASGAPSTPASSPSGNPVSSSNSGSGNAPATQTLF